MATSYLTPNYSRSQISYLNCGGGDRWCRHLSSFRELLRAKSYCTVLKVNDRRTSSPLPRRISPAALDGGLKKERRFKTAFLVKLPSHFLPMIAITSYRWSRRLSPVTFLKLRGAAPKGT
ncbi:hypothetical protein TNCV_4432661 [Trichonephila clavipes]|nr:hypothetical protein TNCV_4432661 [Trichonephila clavipes]